MNKGSILSFLKKYPMTIMLAIIATNLISISYSQKQAAKMSKYAEACIRWDTAKDPKKVDAMTTKVSKLVGIAEDRVYKFCSTLYYSGRGT